MLMLQRRVNSRPPHRIATHEYFEARLEEECARCARTGAVFSVVRIHGTDPGAKEQIEQALRGTLRTHDVVAHYAPGDYELLLDASPEVAAEVVCRVRDRLAASNVSIRAGLAGYPHDGATPGALLARANASVRGDAPEEVSGRPLSSGGAMAGLRELVSRVAPSMINVLILGETGVGKEVMAEEIHRLSRRPKDTFLRLNCAALSEPLLESELFGHERGSFTGAFQQKRGLLEMADGGTVFIDEVGELPQTIQVKLLRVLEERRITSVGGVQSRAIDVRFVAATNRDLEGEVARGRFRQDLLFRLDGVTVVVPPLRERVDEIIPLARAFAEQATPKGQVPPSLARDTQDLIERYAWPGNIRELRNVIERAVLLCGQGPIAAAHLPREKMSTSGGMVARTDAWPAVGTEKLTALPPATVPPATLRADIERVERQRIVDALEQCAYNQTKAARLLGLARGTLISRMEQYGLARPRKPQG
jgi:two-component system response regulator AtoC